MPLTNSQKQARYRKKQKVIIAFYELLTGLSAKEVSKLIKIIQRYPESTNYLTTKNETTKNGDYTK